MRFVSVGVVLLFALLAIAPARAQSPSPEAIAAARDLVVVMKLTENMKATLPTIMQAMRPAIVQGRPEIDKDYDAIASMTIAMTLPRLSELVDRFALIYAYNFTVDEMRDLKAFYESPTGQKVLRSLPTVTRQSMAAGQEWGKTITADLQKHMIEELRKRGHNI